LNSKSCPAQGGAFSFALSQKPLKRFEKKYFHDVQIHFLFFAFKTLASVGLGIKQIEKLSLFEISAPSEEARLGIALGKKKYHTYCCKKIAKIWTPIELNLYLFKNRDGNETTKEKLDTLL
jgi:hypothetical protein